MAQVVDSASAYIAHLDHDWRRATLLELRGIIRQAAPELQEVISYGMIGFSLGNDMVFHLAAQRRYVSLYVGNAAQIDPDGDLLAGLDVGKGCIRFTKSKAVATTRIAAFITRAVVLWRGGAHIGC